MLNKIIYFSIHNKLIVLLFTFLVAVVGAWAFTQLPIDAIPDNTNNQVQILTVCPTLATQEVEQFITSPIENAVKSIPGVLELRSISRFGLSVITVVFDDHKDIYLARQLINEKLKAAEAIIPAGYGTPELAPISTGLGEILHYRIEPKPGYENKYTASDLRTIQDWIVKKQLTGIPGVVEINSFGGQLKQYEVAVMPERLRAMGIGIQEVFSALEMANENTGGAYIEKTSSAYFIRADGLAKSLDDIRQILIKNINNQSIKIGDVADVRIGSALRYGAVSHNGEGEIVLGIVMMLKGENASAVIKLVKARLEDIAKTLPEGVGITTFLDREKLVNRTIATVERNLIEGALIVIFILVLLVGNFRAGLIIASVIPLAMLFALWMMQIFGVSANLMSLGALDFGLIVDGAVIIVEATLHYLHTKVLRFNGAVEQIGHDAGKEPGGKAVLLLSQAEMNESVFISASGIMRSSVFGVIIILIVYLPILSLTGVEGRMFGPMAQTVSFALVGALLLSLTYVPAMSALVLSKKMKMEHTFADRIIAFFQRIYEPVLFRAFHWRKSVVAATLVVMAISVAMFMRMGGEFIPTLDEGDIMMHGFLRPGTSLTQTLESHRIAQKIILDNFPNEVEQVISKIGTAEIPTDPMAIETADNIILLKDKKGWTKAQSKEELVSQIEEKVHEVPGMAFEFTQPIKMRFDEMMTGVRSDIAVKVFGDNLDTLANAGHLVENLLKNVPGLVDLKVEQVEGLPQIMVKYDFAKMARYGMHIREVNETLRAAFAGASAGVVFEDEKRFDLVVRLDTTSRHDLTDVQNLPVMTSNGQIIPLSAIADIGYKPGAAQISRDNAQRRIVIGANVRGRDVESAIRDVQQILAAQLKLPTGYHLTYGGQFENLQAAKARLSVAVPVALLLIFVLLFFSFNSVKESALIFSAIPMSAIGGVFALQLRGMPFSISAGVGFIALFGVAVLNGIVLVAYFNQLEKEGVTDVYERIRRGAMVRLRPVLMTAAVASLGFLPMAISHGAGAEVQRPLATVVIGGLITSTLLTLIILPILYAMVFAPRRMGSVIRNKALGILAVLGCVGALQAQTPFTEQDALARLLQNHPAVLAKDYKIQQQEALKGTARTYDPTDFFHNVTADPDLGLLGTSTFGIAQSFPSRKMTTAHQQYYDRKKAQSTAELSLTRQQLTRLVREYYQHLSYLNSKSAVYRHLDSVYQQFSTIAEIRYQSGDAALAEQLAAKDKADKIRLELQTVGHEIAFDQEALGQLLGFDGPVKAVTEPFHRFIFSLADTAAISTSAMSQWSLSGVAVADAQKTVEQAKLRPTASVGAYAQILGNGALYPGWQLGLNVPLLNKGRQKSVEAASLNTRAAQAEYQNTLLEQRAALAHLLHEQEKYDILIQYYEERGHALATELIRSAAVNYKAGEMDYAEFATYLEQATTIELAQLENLYGLNLTVIELKSLTGR